MSKETIVNGIDVSECNTRFYHFKTNICEIGNMKLGELHYLCSENPNCYFKQLKRLQKENEKLKCRIEGLEKCEDIFFQENEDNKKYRQVFEEIREIINKQKPTLDKAISQSEFTLERLCDYEEKYIKILDKINEVLKNEN